MNKSANRVLDHYCAPWLFAAALATIFPHLQHQPLWLSTFTGSLLAYAGWLWWHDQRLPGRWLLMPLVAIACGGVLLEYHTIFGRDAGVGILVVFMSLKLLELRSQRDAMVLVTLGYFLLLTHYFYSQTIPTGLWLITAMTIVTATLIRVHGGAASKPLPTLRYAGLLTLQAIPFMLVLYVLFPRIPGPLWGLPQDAHSARSGLTEQMSPGSFSNLALSSDIVFRVRFEGTVPNHDKLYWRGPVMDVFDGRTWRPYPEQTEPATIQALSPPIRYESTLEASQQRWLLALDAPSPELKKFTVNNRLTVTNHEAIRQRKRFTLISVEDYRFNINETPAILHRNLSLPLKLNPRSRELAEGWRKTSKNPEATINEALTLFSGKDFAYTLQPPVLGEHGIDEFIFQSRKGFCEHYAAAFVVLMRAAGIPARVVGGYQGGEINPVDGFFVVRQSDAHAWAEVWLENRGWVRIDPTATVSPNRIEGGIASAMQKGEPIPTLLALRSDWLRNVFFRWEAINNAWNQQILGYNPERQRELLSRLGLAESSWPALAGLVGIILAGITGWTLYHRPRIDPVQRLWHIALRRIGRRQVNCLPWETPLALQQRINIEKPELSAAFGRVVDAYLAARYGIKTNDFRPLREAIAQLP